jgi:glycerophosphoryl diester phosphodiesterase
VGRVSQFTSAELAQLDAGDGEGIPTLDEVLAALGSDFLHNIEIKGGSADPESLVAAVADCVARHDLAANVVVSSFEEAILQAATRFAPPVAQAALIDPEAPNIPSFFAGTVVHPYFATVDSAFMAWAAERGYRVNVWTINEPEAAQRLAALGVSAFITNYPAKIRAALQ